MDDAGTTGWPPGPLPAGQGRGQLLDAVRTCLASIPEAAHVVVALSGGPDSTALAYLAAEARPDLIVTLAHVRHGLRDDAADVEVVRQHATFLGSPLEVREVEVRSEGRGVAAAARDARYGALRAVAAEVGATAILVGHSADDQAETLLLRIARGTGVSGLVGMAVHEGDLVRPMLHLRREDLRRFVDLEGLPTATDPSNADPEARRVRVRNAVLPALDEVGPDPVGALARLAALAADDEAALERLAVELVAASVVRIGSVRSVRDADLAGQPTAVRRRVWRRLVREVTGGAPPTAAEVAALEALGPGQRRQLTGGAEVSAAGGWRSVAERDVTRAVARPVRVPGTTAWEPAGLVVTARTPGSEAPEDDADTARQIAFELPGAWSPPVPADDQLLAPPGGWVERCHLALAGDGPWTLRHRERGDRIHTSVGTARVAVVLVDAGVPRPVRERWPVLVDGDDQVVWVPGVAADVDALPRGRAGPAVHLTVGPAP